MSVKRSKMRSARIRWCACASALLLIAAACSSTGSQSGSAASAGTGGSSSTSASVSSDGAGSSTTDLSSASTASATAAAAGIKTIAFGVANQSASQFSVLANNFVNFGKKAGIAVNVYNNNSDATTAISNAQLMVQSKPDVIVEFAPVADATARLTQIFKDSKIPCIAMNIPVEGCAFFNQSQETFAQLQAENFWKLMQAKGWNAQNTSIIIEQGSQLGPTVNIAVTKFYDDLSAMVPGMVHVPASKITTQTTTLPNGLQIDPGVNTSAAYTDMSQALQSIPTGQNMVIYTVTDDTVVGTYRALTNAGRQGKAMMAGFGCDEHSIAGLRTNPSWVGESCGFFPYWGEFLIAMAAAVKGGATTPDTTFSPMVVLTKDNVNTFFPNGSTTPAFMPPLPKESQYLAATGILQKIGNVKGL